VRLLAVETALAAGDAAQAARVLGTPPVPVRRPELFLGAQLATQAGPGVALSDVAQRLQLWLAAQPRDAQAWQLLASAYTAQGQPLPAIRAEAEIHIARLDYPAALDRLKAAQALVRQGRGTDHIEASIIDTRQRQVALLVKEQALEH
jgi:predicted Zn-dependent protease